MEEKTGRKASQISTYTDRSQRSFTASEYDRLSLTGVNNNSVMYTSQNIANSAGQKNGPVRNGDYIYEFLDTIISDQKIIAITRVSTGQRVYRQVPRIQYEELVGMEAVKKSSVVQSLVGNEK